MKITKIGHSCIYVETPESAVLFDPGGFYPVSPEIIPKLDHIFITHEHSDHYNLESLQSLLAKFPGATITSTQAVVDMLQEHAIQATTTAPDGAQLFTSPHESIEVFGATPQQIGVHYLETVSHPGDSHSFTETMPVLFLPVTAPWGNTIRAVELAIELKPRVVIPVHDWFFTEAAVEFVYGKAETALKAHGIQFIGLKPGESITLSDLDLL
ncbi:MAG: MBL fold metallo-hydrolase [Candidatus Saccharimonadales bacterium]